MAEALKPADYTSALIGKWHLGGAGYHPEDQGFDVNVGGGHVGMPVSYFYPKWTEKRAPNAVQGAIAIEGREGEYLTDRIAQESVQFLEMHKDTAPSLQRR